MNWTINAKELILTDGTRSPGTETFVYEPATVDEDPFGNLYLIGWLENHKTRFEFLPNLVASIIRREFYKLGEGEPELQFESALRKANAAFEDISKANKSVVSDANFCVVNIAGDKVRFSKFGDVVTLLYREGEVVDMSKKYRARSRRELFSAVITGNVYPKDKLIVGGGRVMDLFSEKGIEKLFRLHMEEEADVITRIYQKNSKEVPLPSQAAILLELKEPGDIRRWLPLPTKAAPVPPQTRPGTPHGAGIGVFMKRARERIFQFTEHAATGRNLTRAAGAIALLACALVAAHVGTKFAALRTLSEKASRAEVLGQKQEAQARALLQEVRSGALALMPSWYLTAGAVDVFNDADARIQHLAGIHAEPALPWVSIATQAFNFTPSFVFDDAQAVYVFGVSPDSFLTIQKQSGQSSFTFLQAEPFETKRMFLSDGDFYFVNDEAKSAYVLFKGERELIKVARTIQKTLATPSPQGKRETQSGIYTLAGAHRIVKASLEGTKDTFLFGGLPAIVDFVVSESDAKIYLLTKERIFVFPHI